MAAVDLNARIPNNVGLADDPKIRRALEHWQPKYLDWWREMGLSQFAGHEVYLRTAIDVGADGWANFGYVKMPDYRWGVFLSTPGADPRVPAGDHAGSPVWREVPGEHRNALRRIIVTQADTEPASVEQQRLLGASAPSLYDMRNLFQVNVEEGRHLWAMVYLLHKYFGVDGRDEADELLERRSGNPDKPRVLATFNDPCEHWLSFFAFTMFTDRDGKFQLSALRGVASIRWRAAASSCSPRRRSTSSSARPGSSASSCVRPNWRCRTPTVTRAAKVASASTRCSARSTRGSRAASTCSAARSRATPPTTSRPGSRVASTSASATRTTSRRRATTACRWWRAAAWPKSTCRCATP
ncbi:MAG: hypothetical protein U0168_20925 [Nannocystaceae bacterium]